MYPTAQNIDRINLPSLRRSTGRDARLTTYQTLPIVTATKYTTSLTPISLSMSALRPVSNGTEYFCGVRPRTVRSLSTS
ncbi:hypothetical protein L226DRAFT_377759 [Lentinus tigrinus ALCF2SS1-7]|uniref:uncharacterized protein n=1 Tax=Lentinus tigrinus ALCF2SS1-7 TaxID=1328758 RepID=UPI001166149F|nr:hypothetical protein L226DRAFT_377759 [Lentinus tigrinus ALCF2SS1-7]